MATARLESGDSLTSGGGGAGGGRTHYTPIPSLNGNSTTRPLYQRRRRIAFFMAMALTLLVLTAAVVALSYFGLPAALTGLAPTSASISATAGSVGSFFSGIFASVSSFFAGAYAASVPPLATSASTIWGFLAAAGAMAYGAVAGVAVATLALASSAGGSVASAVAANSLVVLGLLSATTVALHVLIARRMSRHAAVLRTKSTDVSSDASPAITLRRDRAGLSSTARMGAPGERVWVKRANGSLASAIIERELVHEVSTPATEQYSRAATYLNNNSSTYYGNGGDNDDASPPVSPRASRTTGQ